MRISINPETQLTVSANLISNVGPDTIFFSHPFHVPDPIAVSSSSSSLLYPQGGALAFLTKVIYTHAHTYTVCVCVFNVYQPGVEVLLGLSVMVDDTFNAREAHYVVWCVRDFVCLLYFFYFKFMSNEEWYGLYSVWFMLLLFLWHQVNVFAEKMRTRRHFLHNNH